MSARDKDEQLLIDFLLGRCDPAAAAAVRERLQSDGAFSALHGDVANALGALGACAVADPPEDLTERTMARIQAARRTEVLIDAAPVEPEGRRRAFSFRELATLAAAVVVAVGILIPSVLRARRLSLRAHCADNIRAIFTGMNHYASGNNEVLPSSGVQGGSWLYRPGVTPASNSAGLFLLVRNDYAPAEVFRCPAAGGTSFVVKKGMIDFPSPRSLGYSYQYNLDGGLRRDDPDLLGVADRQVILADTNPGFRDGRFIAERLHQRLSENHGGTGQNVLHLDGTVFWATDPNVGVDDDNIWLIKGILNYTGREKPASKFDTFLLHYAGR